MELSTRPTHFGVIGKNSQFHRRYKKQKEVWSMRDEMIVFSSLDKIIQF